ncbi:MAG: DUF262 domain-containing protein [Acidobacteriia bacterium]|nr:DUF262 domain-containing protein [Terriglobia bacterium]
MTTKVSSRTAYQELEDELLGQKDASAESEEDLAGLDSASLTGAVVWGTDWTAATILDQLRRQTIGLDPAFQRRDAWTDERKSRFIESLILGLPIPQLVLAESDRIKGKFTIIDGKQRLLSLSRFAGVGLAEGQQPLVLRGLDVRKDLNGATYDALKGNAKFEDLVSSFENQAIRTVVIRGWKNEEVLYIIFHRLNSGSLPLSAQELRQALHPGPFLNFVAKFSEQSEPLRKLLGLSRPDFRMRDVELVVRFYAFHMRLAEYRGNLKKFLDDTCDQLNRRWASESKHLEKIATKLEKAIVAATKIFSTRHAFRKWDGTGFEERLNRAIFDVVAHSLANPALRSRAVEKKAEVLERFKALCLDRKFRDAIESTTKSKQAVRNRFSKWYRTLSRISGERARVALPR